MSERVRRFAGREAPVEKIVEKSYLRSEYVARVDSELCRGCQRCSKHSRCGALIYSSLLAKIQVDPARCYGCGDCSAVCRRSAIRLLPRVQVM